MERESHLFASHKYLEEAGSKILVHLAKMDFRSSREIEIICNHIEDYVTTLLNHAQWEEEFIFNKFFTKDEISTFIEEHTQIDSKGKLIIEALKTLLNFDSQKRVSKGKQIYLDFRIFYALNLTHFYTEETDFLSLLQKKVTDDEIRAIDKPIYEGMTSSEIVEMLESLFPPINISEKKNILADLRNFNPINLEDALPEVRRILVKEEATEILADYSYET